MNESPSRSLPFYAGTGLDRASAERRDPAWVEECLRARTTRIIPVWRNRNLILPAFAAGESPAAVLVTGPHARGLLHLATDVTLLGGADAAHYFAADLSDRDPFELTPILGRAEFLDLRQVATTMDPREAALLAYARGMMFWHRRHRHCGACGAPTTPAEGGHSRICGNVDCGLSHFPRTDPAVIMLVTRPGPEGGACLLGRQPGWPEGMYSTLAGFVEPGEAAEEAVIREVREETGIDVDDVTYAGSQPWPFPSSLMLAFRARARSVHVAFDPRELEDARWFTRDQLRRFAEQGRRLPRTDSIAHLLIADWLAESG